ncbi:O-acetyl-ADP-ribose deacetylase [uncultured Erythrobacter sp.]|uniref:O-acetyl-ADP-ribose deacetylase n=1 Tax=uncultured Erythrobacter sp. TaxID=263913 RepID=UPI00262C073A|nr:O-acetyl-ADP-ribose deacetylase [uncultured Erythrobacter sp.]
MENKSGDTLLEVVIGNIVELRLDAIVNAANSSLLGGGGVDGAIHRAAGPDLVHECRLLGGCKTGEVKVTKGYNLQARHIIHTVGPVWQDGNRGEEVLLGRCYSRSVEAAVKLGARSVGFPAISTGRYRFPLSKAAKVAVLSVKAALTDNPGAIEKVVFVCFDDEAGAAFALALDRY